MTEQYHVPFFAHADFYLGLGPVGGKLNSSYYQGRKAAEITLSIPAISGDHIRIKIYKTKTILSSGFPITEADFPITSIPKIPDYWDTRSLMVWFSSLKGD
ncbi:MAG: hypothetical protein ACLFSE_00285 [Spirochaetia bacterium]